MSEFPTLAAEAVRRGWADEPQIIDEVRERAGIVPEYDNEFESERLLRQAETLSSHSPQTALVIAEAQVRATLFLAEQQHIANLQTEREVTARELIRMGNHTRTGNTAIVARYDALDAEIRKAMG